MSNIVPMSELSAMAKALGTAKMFGKTADELLPLMLIAQAEGKHPAIAAQEYDIIQGRPAINSRAALSRFQAAGGCIQWLSRTDTEVAATFRHPQGGDLTITWTMERAKQAGLTGKDNWRKFPAQMLAARVVAEGVRAVFPACLSGMYTAEEVQDFDTPQRRPPVDITPAPAQIADRFAAQVIEAEPVAATISRQQAKEITETLKGLGISTDALMAHLGVKRLGEIRIDQMATINAWVDEQATDAPATSCPACQHDLINGACHNITCSEGSPE